MAVTACERYIVCQKSVLPEGEVAEPNGETTDFNVVVSPTTDGGQIHLKLVAIRLMQTPLCFFHFFLVSLSSFDLQPQCPMPFL